MPCRHSAVLLHKHPLYSLLTFAICSLSYPLSPLILVNYMASPSRCGSGSPLPLPSVNRDDKPGVPSAPPASAGYRILPTPQYMPAHYIVRIDDEGTVHYFDPVKKCCGWPQVRHYAGPPAQLPQPPAPWEVVFSLQAGLEYFNRETGVRTYTAPEGTTGLLGAPWERRVDYESARV